MRRDRVKEWAENIRMMETHGSSKIFDTFIS